MRYSSILLLVLYISVIGYGKTAPEQNRYLLLDSRIIAKANNAKLVVGRADKYDGNPLFVEDKPWEKRIDNMYGNVVFDEEENIYKLWYSPFIIDNSARNMSLEKRKAIPYDPPDEREMAVCYAISSDGIYWEKPEMGLVEYEGSKANNILLRGEGVMGDHWGGPHGAGIFIDTHDSDPSRRYKAILKADIISVSFSSDGISWSAPVPCPEADVAGDTHNNAFWAPTLGKYVAITRTWGSNEEGHGYRQVGRTESDDFLSWSEAKVVLEGTSRRYQTYAMPTFYYAGVYLGLLAIHDQKRDRVWTELAWSPDTKDWQRISEGQPLIGCSDGPLAYDYGCVYACATPVFLKDEIRLYYGGSDWLHFGWRLGSFALATLRPDGFAGFEQESAEQKAVILTESIPYDQHPIRITADVYKGGSVRVLALDANGSTIAKSRKIKKSMTDYQLEFRKKISSESIQLQFEFSKAKIYSFGFAD
ncbi:hypothetical protein ACFL45_10910 [Candidatus Neomarinimicrobiota bacterium]